MKTLSSKYKTYLADKSFILSTIIGLAFLIFSIVFNYYASLYATEKAGNAVTDIFLSNIKVFDFDGIFIYGPFIVWSFVIALVLIEPKRIPFVLKSVALFVVIRAIFFSLTHIGPFPTQAVIDSGFIGRLYAGSELFFSGHTGLPFLGSLVFWNNKVLRYIFLSISIIFAITVLLAHFHYSIDVLGAYFITYTIYHMACHFFKKDQEMFES